MKAIILAAGQGTRLRPVTLTMPKPMVPVANQPLIAYAIDMLRAADLKEIGIIVNSLESPIVAALGDGSQMGVQLTFIIQAEQKGLAHACGLARDFVGSEPFAMLLGDNIFQDKMHSMLTGFEASDSEAAIGVGEVADPSRFGIAQVEGDRVLRVVEKPKEFIGNLAISGVYLFRNSIFDAIANIKPSWRNELEITDAIQYLVSSGKKVSQYTIGGWWIDAGKPDAIVRANQLVLGDMPYSPPPEGENIENSEVSARVVLGEGSKIINSVVRGPVVIGSGVTISNSYVGPYTAIGNNVTVEHSEIEASIVMQDCVLKGIDGRIDGSLMADGSIVSSSGQSLPKVHRFILAEDSYVQL
ncbi:MAG: glucose-1-phosphate thymidylyltransferase [Anaerolineae bacterium]|nr:glucose-1-phosphate thymidylyltransferase [Chloroflexota bacterium]MBP6297812.1 glucose-1-phosphate thymidylyltransferase [Anaerolineae bacterium]